MFNAIVIGKTEDAPQIVLLQQLDEANLPVGDVSIDLAGTVRGHIIVDVNR